MVLLGLRFTFVSLLVCEFTHTQEHVDVKIFSVYRIFLNNKLYSNVCSILLLAVVYPSLGCGGSGVSLKKNPGVRWEYTLEGVS